MQSGYGVPELQQFMVDGCGSLLSISQEMGNPSQQQNPQRMPHFSPVHITHQLFHHQQFHAFQPQPQQRRLHHPLGLHPEPAPPPDPPQSPPGAGISPPHFVKLVMTEDDSMLRCEQGSGGRPVHRWLRGEEAAIKEPFWKPLDIDCINKNNKRVKGLLEVEVPAKYSKKDGEGDDNEEGKSAAGNYGLFSELEAIYAAGAANNQAGSGSGLTGDNTAPASTPHHGSETSTGEEAAPERRRAKKRKGKQMSFLTGFFQRLVKQLMDHQESLHRRFLEVMERRDQERTEREAAWRRQEAARSDQEAMARAREQALASSREAAIISFLEKITGESIKLPEKTTTPETHDEERKSEPPGEDLVTHLQNPKKKDRRWPKTEVQALIRVRSNLEARFQEPGLKAPLWEEVSASMASMGYQRNAKRCKEKWENINKYFRKTKDSAKKRARQSKTCPYFHQLDQLYSKSQKESSELLEAIVVPSDDANLQNPSLDFVQELKFPDMGPLDLDRDFYNKGSELDPRQVLLQLQQEQSNEEDNQDEEEEEDEDAGGGEDIGGGGATRNQ